jgi:hypothetical protein
MAPASALTAARLRVRVEGTKVKPPCVRPCARPLGGERPKILDVVGDDGAPFAGRDLEDG